MDGTLLEAYASLKSFQPKDRPANPSDDDPGNPSVNFRGQRRSYQTHQSTTDPDSRLFRKAEGQPSRLAYSGNVLIENRHGLVVGTRTLPAIATVEREAALALCLSCHRTADVGQGFSPANRCALWGRA